MRTPRALVLYESLFGNTAAIARAIARGLRDARPDAVVECRSVDETADVPGHIDLVVVGAPTHFWGTTGALSRAMELQYERRFVHRANGTGTDARRAVRTDGIRAGLAALPPGGGRAAAVFDTCMTGPLTGGARRIIARRLDRAGYRLVAEPETFLVEAVAGPLRSGEVDRAHAWGVALAEAVDRTRP